ncbi:hypothetical protein [Streptomyces sp. NBC_01803]|uniref:hypothetical protein n=1 Tax=Streptomyces sp. NBC_01803 TaxID=2975946 RepID=UPI002DDC5797|nr:hypothetical protein [Streptomyces sp. NBC_01803]WSA43142.1 hypothetical protein OIE51_02390 [Streptomyces sp. NBC_01803]
MIAGYLTRSVGLLAALGLALGLTVVVGTPAEAGAGSDYLNKGERLYHGQRIWREVAGYNNAELVMQSDGNLVLYSYGPVETRVCWASNTQGSGGAFVEYQQDGNLVIYNGDYRPVWSSNTAGTGGTNTNINYHGQVWVGDTALTPYCT